MIIDQMVIGTCGIASVWLSQDPRAGQQVGMHCRASGPAVLDARHLDGRPVGYLRPFVRLHHRVAARVSAPLARMRYLSVCSGIEAASCAWHPLGWEPVAFSEIEAFPSAVLAHHYPDTPNWGDMTAFKEWPHADVDVLVGGTPCQSFSVAGLRKGLADPRGNLMLTYLAIAAKYRPTWLVWENVPGVLSSNGGRDFGTFLGGLGELGYGFAYRVLDAQYFGVAQRRRRVFVVGCLEDWRRAAAVLFERESLSGNPAPRREAREGVAGAVTQRIDREDGHTLVCMSTGQGNAEIGIGIGTTLNCNHEAPILAHTLRAEGFDASEDGTGRRTPLVPVAFGWQNSSQQGASASASASVTPTLDKSKVPGIGIGIGMAVRRLTPRECERLQGFPDDYTLITVRGKPAADGPRYKALGNSMAVPCMAWIGRRIAMVEAIGTHAESLGSPAVPA